MIDLTRGLDMTNLGHGIDSGYHVEEKNPGHAPFRGRYFLGAVIRGNGNRKDKKCLLNKINLAKD